MDLKKYFRKFRIRLNIASKIWLAFGIITLAVIFNVLLTNTTLDKSKEYNKVISEIYSPSVELLDQLNKVVEESFILSVSWINDQVTATPNKLRLMEIHEKEFPSLLEDLQVMKEKWDPQEQEIYEKLKANITDTIMKVQKDIMKSLDNIDDYYDPSIVFFLNETIEEGGELKITTLHATDKLKNLIDIQKQNINTAQAEMANSFNNLRSTIIIMGIILAIVIVLMAIIVINSLIKPINHIKGMLLDMSKGILPTEKVREQYDEIGQMSLALNKLVSGLKEISSFAVEVGKGNFNSSFKPLSDQDSLGNSLISMREELKKAEVEEQKRKVEDEQRNWTTAGIAKFGEILRHNNRNVDELSYSIISELVQYTGANQGGIFLINDQDKNNIHVELKACYAYNRQKYLQKEIKMGVGLVGRCIQEKETIFLTDIPKGYINITSGLGEDNPRSLLLVPLTMNQQIFGVIEMASFRIFQPFQVEFLERIGETIASTIATARVNNQTTLLLEQSRQQAEEMASQEEEMRQNMEELRATQEESARREKEMQKELDQLKMRLISGNSIN